MKYGCIGEVLRHSFSKEIHAQLGDYQYELCEVKREELDSFMKRADFLAINVTIPYKEAVIPYLDSISDIASEIGAVNTIVKRDGKLYGYNTDFYGLKALIERTGFELAGKKVAVLGTGGTSKTANAVAKSLGAGEILVVSRRAGEGVIDYDELYADHSDTQIVINCTPVGMFPNSDASPIEVGRLPALQGAVDAVYNPLNTQLVQQVREGGARAQSGLFMLVYQAIKASEFFFDTTYPAEIAEEIYKKTLMQKQNIVLIGMPASGKSTVGKLLAQDLGRELVDTDEMIEKRLGCTIAEVFETRGEGYFRSVEAQVIAELSAKNGLVIATGGGAVLRSDNVMNLHKNSVVFFIDRSPENLYPTCDRPLASTVEAIHKRYSERYAIYCRAADVRVDCDALTPDEACAIIVREFNDYEDICN
ncbi:MAG: shikimate dehydrogenase [Clostridia bacterium]|nr:shikimate dehydrogenase [Clostridia bacterium]